MDYEKAYKESFEAAKGLHDAGNALTKKQMEIVFPQLAESEDERIRKALFKVVSDIAGGWSFESHGITKKDALAYLEKQKEQSITANDLDEEIHRFFDDCIDVHEAKLYGSISERVIPVDCYEITARHFAKWGEEQKEQKPVEHLPKEKVFDIMRNLTALSYSKRIPINSDEYGWIHKITEDVRSLLDYPIEQKPAEWSEEDEKQIRQIERIVKDAGCTQKLQEQIHNWFKSIRPTHWKPSEVCYGEKGDPDPAGVWKPAEELIVRLEQWLKDKQFDGDSRSVYPIFESLYKLLKLL